MNRVPMLYNCRRCDVRPETRRATNNVPKYGHLCEQCFALCPKEHRVHYVQVSGPFHGTA